MVHFTTVLSAMVSPAKAHRLRAPKKIAIDKIPTVLGSSASYDPGMSYLDTNTNLRYPKYSGMFSKQTSTYIMAFTFCTH